MTDIVRIPHGQEMMELELLPGYQIDTRAPRPMTRAENPRRKLATAIKNGFDEVDLDSLVQPGSTACIAVPDRTRSNPNQLILPIVLDTLNQRGVPDGDISVISGGGMHAADDPTELRRNVGKEVMERVDVLTNQPDDDGIMVQMGTSSAGTPVEIHRRYAQADIKLGTTNINPCMLAGWSGSGKIVMPGIASRAGIYHNHKFFVPPLRKLGCASLMGVLPPENPVRADLEECATIGGLDMTINTVLNAKRELVEVFCGKHVPAHRAAVEFMKPYVEVSLPQPVDIMIAGVGDPALEVSLFQGGSRVCGGVDRYLKPGGTLIMVNACEEGIYEGFEHEEFRGWMKRMPSPEEIGNVVQEGELGGEKGCVLFTFSWLLHEMNCRIIIVTHGMSEEELQEVHLGHDTDVQSAFDRACRDSHDPRIGLLPYAGLVLPTRE